MKIKTIVLGAMLAIGCGTGLNVQAWGLSQCCHAKQSECELNYGPAACAGVYEACMRSRRCILN